MKHNWGFDDDDDVESLSPIRYVHKSHDTSKCFKASAVAHSFGRFLSNGWHFFDRFEAIPNYGECFKSVVLKDRK